ncbi:thiopeptide maturation pyridine synthase [Catenulispora pinisilvae]|uniref:thiopeptide maturation pyridine synthase n=1 Tax=Catenulispora pinisilvae TaxID=2705253 RepID=UPI001891519A|nr:thiopeptide maturation pyridine synthase [Catenulispora pinisilvae]
MTLTPASAAGEWRAAHIAYFAEDRDRLLLDAIRPTIERCVPHVDSVYVLRHWRRGPHLRLVVHAEPAVFDDVVGPAVTELVGGYLRAHPSTAPELDVARVLPAHRRLAELEREPGPLTPFYQDNTITWHEHDRRIEVLGCPVGADELALFYAKTNTHLFEHLEAVAAGADRQVLALRLMLATAHALCRHPQDPTIRRGFVSLRSHAEGYLSTVPPTARDTFEQNYAGNRAALTGLVRSVVDVLDADEAVTEPEVETEAGAEAEAEAASGGSFERGWIAAIEPLGARWAALYEAGEIPEADIPTDAENGIEPMLERSPLHKAIAGNVAYKDMMYRDPRFLRYRLMLNYTYLHLTRLGVPGLTRYLLCHLAANAVEEVYGVSALDLVLRTVAENPNPVSATADHA